MKFTTYNFFAFKIVPDDARHPIYCMSLLSTPIFQHSVWNVVTAHKLTPDKVRRNHRRRWSTITLRAVLFAATDRQTDVFRSMQ